MTMILVFIMSSIHFEHSEVNNNNGWKNIYQIGGFASFGVAIFIPIQILIFMLYPPPTTVQDWFKLFHDNRIIGLLDMDLLLIIDQIFFAFIFLALYIKLSQVEKSFTLIALVSALMGIISYFSSTIAFEMLSLSDKYASTVSESEKNNLLIAGQTLLTRWTGTSFDIGYILLGIGILIINVIMLRSADFNKITAYIGIIAGILSLIPASFGIIGLIFAFLSLFPLELWSILIFYELIIKKTS